ncbi:MAG: sugar ABC transporter substrate-binding protein [Verrucomicrobia bacterium]|nr:sugar ABC transporter substrate-binding protein [Verrucomicrobiota bacterium]
MKLSKARIICFSASLLLFGSALNAKTLTVLLLANASTQDVIQNFFREYSRDHPGIDFNVSIVQFSALTAKINTLVTAGEPPDILEVTTTYIQTFAEQALDLAKYTNGAGLLNRYLPSYQAFIRSGDKVIGIPIEATVNGLFYNKALFKEAGVSVPSDPDHVWTWSEFKDTLARLVKLPSCRIGVAFDCSVQRWSNLLYQANGRWISPDGKTVLPNREAARQALTYLRSLIEAKLVPTSSWPGKTDGGPLFETGVTALMWAGNWELKTLVGSGTYFPFGTTYFPKDVIRAACPGGELFIGFTKSRNQEDAAKVLLWWADPSTIKRYLESLGGSLLSPMKDLPINYGKYTDYLKPMLSDLSVTPPWVAEDLAKPELNLMQNDLLDQLILYSTGRSPLDRTISEIEKIGSEVEKQIRPAAK